MFNFIKKIFGKDEPVINFACRSWGVRKYAPIQQIGFRAAAQRTGNV